MQIIHHNEQVFSIPHLLSSAECAGLIRLAEAGGFQEAIVRTASGEQSLPQIRNNQRCLLEHPAWRAQLWARLQQAGLPVLDGAMPAGLPRELRFYKYAPGQRFKMHKDGPWEEDGLRSKLTCLVYLNDDFSGGATDFRQFQIQPETGSALLFVHAVWHEGCVLESGVKYVLRSDVLYAPA
ncbi:2OG-Fe(II) oxygenase [Massilia sp. W12]|uniref:prolyl hydroxylase family protein n=1 Tax=Massilia sp. W12 TaxID=3126507 RepID=UPI0030CD407D